MTITDDIRSTTPAGRECLPRLPDGAIDVAGYVARAAADRAAALAALTQAIRNRMAGRHTPNSSSQH